MATKTKTATKSATKPARKIMAKTSVKQAPKATANLTVRPKTKIRPAPVRAVVHVPPISAQQRRAIRAAGMTQFAYMKAPGAEHAFEVGDTVEVFCDHERSNERVRGWIKGIVVQVDNKMVAVQFRSNVFLTDGWMVPDRILWYPVASDQIRVATFARKGSHKEIPDY